MCAELERISCLACKWRDKGKSLHYEGPVPFLSDEHLTPGVEVFLKVVNSGAPVESLPKLAARQVLIDAQKAFKVDYSGITESEKEIQADGFTIKLNIVKPEGPKDGLPPMVRPSAWMAAGWPW